MNSQHDQRVPSQITVDCKSVHLLAVECTVWTWCILSIEQRDNWSSSSFLFRETVQIIPKCFHIFFFQKFVYDEFHCLKSVACTHGHVVAFWQPVSTPSQRAMQQKWNSEASKAFRSLHVTVSHSERWEYCICHWVIAHHSHVHFSAQIDIKARTY